jgi:hypothetical protein
VIYTKAEGNENTTGKMDYSLPNFVELIVVRRFFFLNTIYSCCQICKGVNDSKRVSLFLVEGALYTHSDTA